MSRKLTQEFVEAAYLKGNIKLLSIYISNLVKNDLECLDCGYLWRATFSGFYNDNCGCPKCSGKLKHTHEFVQAEYLNDDIKLLSNYINNHSKNSLECLICDYKWKATYKDFKFSNSGCPKCSGNLKYTHEFVESVYLNDDIKLLSVYVASNVKNNLQCLICDHLWKASFSCFHNKNCGCPECWRLSIIGENNSSWNHDLTKEDRENSYNRNHIPGYYLWVKAVFDRDGYICQCCGYSKGGTLNAHHIDSWKDHKDDRFNIDNGVTLCKTCHTACHAYHKKRYYPSATYKLFYEWMAKYSVIKPENWSWTVRYPDAMNKRLIFFKRAS